MSRLRKFLAVVVASALAATGLIGLSGSPAYAQGGGCRPNYLANGWDATVCTDIGINFPNLMSANAAILSHPSNCGTYKVYVADFYGGRRFLRSTAAKSCNVRGASTDAVYWSEFVKDKNFDVAAGYGTLIAWDTSGRQILAIEAPLGYMRRF